MSRQVVSNTWGRGEQPNVIYHVLKTPAEECLNYHGDTQDSRMGQLVLEEWEVVEKKEEGEGDIQGSFHWRRDFCC